MKLTKEAIISIGLVILSIGSISGFAFSGSNYRNNNSKNIDSNKQIDSNLPIVVFKTTIDSNIFEMYPQLIFVANTTNYNANEIQNKLDTLDNVSKSQVNFSKDQNSQIILIGRVIYTNDAKDQVIKNINDFNFLSNVYVYQTALGTIPTDSLTLVSDNNITKKYTFTKNAADAVVTTDTLKGDTINGQLQVEFQGNTPKNIQLMEIKNISAQPKPVYGLDKLKINHWIDMFKIDANSDINVDVDKNILDSLLDLNVSLTTKVNGTLDYNVSDTNATNKYLKEQKDMNNSVISNYTLDNNKTSIKFSKDFNYSKYLKLQNYLDNNLEGNLISQPNKSYEIVFDTNNINVSEITKLLSNINLKITDISKQAEMNTTKLTINDENYSYDKNTNVWLMYPVDLNKTEINLNVQAYAQRNKMMVVVLKEN